MRDGAEGIRAPRDARDGGEGILSEVGASRDKGGPPARCLPRAEPVRG
ncbi:hypothetical protein H0B56_20785 [Haloechinothrix sp. YIM 98757]|uniref:Uncharacterized protein n=1 Tax=Haloechinothrix aidingensis TaxID=2752311 RepID=A0A838AFU6_9PSEU|nr:hypothetical protein [Haloechinothrix aidingensis]MBA0127988.1 hypothetical protein [Haloechinothrix aidingensis]